MGNLPGVGHDFPPKKVSWLKRDVLLFNVSIGCKADELHYLYEKHTGFAAFPTFPLSLYFKGTSQEVLDFYTQQSHTSVPGVPTLDPRFLVDGERAIRFLKPLPVTSVGHDFEIRESVLGVFDKGKSGTVLKTEYTLTDAGTSEHYAVVTGSLFYVGQGGWGGPRGVKTASLRQPERPPDGVIDIHVQEESAHLYRLNGDYNPLHGTPEPGQAIGHGGIILHGVYAYNRVAHDLLRQLGHGDPANMKEFQAKFAGVVKPGDTLQTRFWLTRTDSDGWTEVIFITNVASREGKVCLNDGRAIIKVKPLRNSIKL